MLKAEIHGDLGVKALMRLTSVRKRYGWQHGMVEMVAEAVHLADTARKVDMRTGGVAAEQQQKSVHSLLDIEH